MSEGRAWVFGDDVDTDVLAPGLYMRAPLDELAGHCLEAVEPTFADEVKPGDIMVAGRNFGMGSSREQAAEVLKYLGVTAIVAKSFGGIFFRNALNLGLPALICVDVYQIKTGDRLRIEAEAGRIFNESQDKILTCDALPPQLMDMVRAGGLIAHLEQRFKNKEVST